MREYYNHYATVNQSEGDKKLKILVTEARMYKSMRRGEAPLQDEKKSAPNQ
jgi:hypothetical protein